MTFEKFAKEHWQPCTLLALKPSSARIYQFNLDKYAIPTLGPFAAVRRKPGGYSALSSHRVFSVNITRHSSDWRATTQYDSYFPHTIASEKLAGEAYGALSYCCLNGSAHWNADWGDSRTAVEPHRFPTRKHRGVRDIL